MLPYGACVSVGFCSNIKCCECAERLCVGSPRRLYGSGRYYNSFVLLIASTSYSHWPMIQSFKPPLCVCVCDWNEF